jgi:hypothetical protein
MTAASPFPDAVTPQSAQVGYNTERGETIPGWYVRNPHTDPTLVVKQDGVPLVPQITVGQVAPERRWAIGLDGNLMDQVKFREKVIQKNQEFYAIARTEGRNAKPAQGYRFERDPIPNVVKFVQWRVDPEDETKLLGIHYDPHATDGAKPDHFVDKKGNPVEGDRMQHLCAAWADDSEGGGRSKLTAKERAEVQEHLGLSGGAGTGGLQARLEQLTEMHDAGDITDAVYIRKVGELTGVAPSKPEPAEETAAAETQKPGRRAPAKKTAPCGEQFFAMHLKRHIAKCEDPACVDARKDSS